MKEEQQEEKPNKPIKKPKRGGSFYLLLRIFRILFLTAVVLLLLLQPILNSSFANKKIQSILNNSFSDAFHWSSYRISLIKREIVLRDFALTERGDTLASVDKVVFQFRPIALLSNTVKITKAELYSPHITFHIDSNGTNGYTRLFVKDPPKEKEESEPFKFLLRGVLIENGSFSFKDASSGMKASLNNLQTSLYFNSEFKDCDLDLSLNTLHYSDPERVFDFDTLGLFLEMIDGNITNTELLVQNDSTKLALGGSLSSPFFPREIGGNLSLDVIMPMGVLQNITGDPKSGSGVLTLKGTHQGSFNMPTLDLDATFRGRDFFYSPINTIDLSVKLDTMLATIETGKASFDSGEQFTVKGAVSIAEIFPQGFFKGFVYNGLYKMKWDAEATASHKPAKEALYDQYKVVASGSGVGVLPDSIVSSLKVIGESGVFIEMKKSALSLSGNFGFTRNELHIKDATLLESNNKVLSFSGGVDLSKKSLDITCLFDSLRLESLLPTFFNIPAKGIVNSTIHAKGAWSSPDIDVDLNASGLIYDQIPLGNLETKCTYDHVEGSIFWKYNQRLDKNSVSIRTEGKLFDPHSFSLRKNPHLALNFALNADLSSFIKEGIAGVVVAQGDYAGNLQKGSGKLSIESDSIVTPYASLEGISLATTFKDGLLEIQKGVLDLPKAGAISVAGVVETDFLHNVYTGDLSVNAKEVILDSIPYLSDMKLSGTVGVDAKISGDLIKPTVSLTGALESFSYDTYDLLSPVLCTLSYGADSVALHAVYDKTVLDASYSLKTGFYALHSTLREFSLDELFSYLKLDRLNGDLDATVSVEGTGSEITRGTVIVDSFLLFDGLKRIVETDTVSLSYGGGVSSIDTMVLTFNDTASMIASGEVTNSGIVDLSLRGDLPLANIASFIPGIARTKGAIVLNMTLDGTLSDIEPSGSIFLNNLGCTILSTDQIVKKVSGSLTFSKAGIIKPIIEADIGESGYILVNGVMALDSMKLKKSDLDISLYKVPIVVPDMVDVVLGGELAYDIHGEQTPRLSGALELIEGYYYQDIKIIPDLTTRKRKSIVKADSTKPLLDLDVKLLPKGNLVVDNNLAYLEIVPDIQVKGSERKTILEGRAEVENGEISYLNTRFEVKQGQIDFVNPERIQMDVNITAEAEIRHYLITLVLTGDPESNLDFHLSGVDKEQGGSVNDEDVLSIALTGYTMEELSVTGDEAIKKLLSAFVNSQIDESSFKMIDRVSYEYLGENSNKFTFGEDLTRRLSTDVELEFSDGTAKQKAIFNFKIQDNVSINSFINSEDNSGGEVGFEFKKR